MDPATFSQIQACAAAGDLAGAEAVCAGAAEREQTNPVFWQVRGSIALMAQKWDDAEAYYRNTLLLAPDAPEAWLGIARASASAGRSEMGGLAARRALRGPLNDDNTIAAREILAHDHFSNGDIDAGREQLGLLVPLYHPKFVGGAHPPSAILRGALPAALCGDDRALVQQILKLMYPHAKGLDTMAIAPLAGLEEWCRDAGVACRRVEQPRDIVTEPTTPYSRRDQYRTDPVLFASIPGGQWVPGWDFALGSDGTVLQDSGYLNIVHIFNHVPHAFFPAAKLAAHRSPDRVEHVDEDVLWVSAPMHNHIGHWMIDFLPRLKGLAHAGRRLKIAIPDTLSDAKFRETLALGGVSANDIIPCSPQARYQFRTLHIYRAGTSMPPHPTHVDYVRDLMRLNPRSAKPRHKRFYLSRTPIGTRLVINAPEFQKFLDANGFVTVDMAAMTFAEQADCFAEAEIILGALGTDQFAVYFAPKGCTLISMQWDPDKSVDPCVPPTCNMLGIKHQFLLCKETRKSKNARSWVDLDFVVDCTELGRRVREIAAFH